MYSKKKMIAIILAASLLLYLGILIFSGALQFKAVLSGSMSPTFNAGDVIVISKVNPEEIKKGDIITFKTGNTLTTHRVIEINGNGFMTKGDANEGADASEINAASVVGKFVFTIPYFGYFGKFIRTPLGYAIFIIIPAILIILIELGKIKEELNKGSRYVYGQIFMISSKHAGNRFMKPYAVRKITKQCKIISLRCERSEIESEAEKRAKDPNI